MVASSNKCVQFDDAKVVAFLQVLHGKVSSMRLKIQVCTIPYDTIRLVLIIQNIYRYAQSCTLCYVNGNATINQYQAKERLRSLLSPFYYLFNYNN